MGLLGLAAGAIGFYGVAPAQLLTVTSVFSVFMVCSAAGEQICCNLRPYPHFEHIAGWMSHQGQQQMLRNLQNILRRQGGQCLGSPTD